MAVSGNTSIMDGHRERAVRQVLQGLTYPAEKWQIITQAELYGADSETRGELYRLPMREYRGPAEVTAALDGDAGNGDRPGRRRPV